MDTHKPFIAHKASLPLKSMGYWLPDVALSFHSENEHLYYRYETTEREWLIEYTGFAPPLDEIPAHTLLHVALFPWWKAGNIYASTPDSRIPDRAYLYIAGWY